MTAISTDAVLQKEHGIFPKPTAEEESRQLFVKSLKYHLASKVAPGNKLAYETRAKPEWVRAKGSEPKDYNAIRTAMAGDPYFRMWSALQRTSQEMMWRSVQVSVERDLDQLKSKAQPKGETLGSLTLDPTAEIPAYHTAVDIHCMPGGYHSEFGEGDVANGAVYDRAVWLYAMGRMGPLNDDMGWTVGEYLKRNHPDFKPQRILDMGCTVGHSTLPYVDLFPEAAGLSKVRKEPDRFPGYYIFRIIKKESVCRYGKSFSPARIGIEKPTEVYRPHFFIMLLQKAPFLHFHQTISRHIIPRLRHTAPSKRIVHSLNSTVKNLISACMHLVPGADSRETACIACGILFAIVFPVGHDKRVKFIIFVRGPFEAQMEQLLYGMVFLTTGKQAKPREHAHGIRIHDESFRTERIQQYRVSGLRADPVNRQELAAHRRGVHLPEHTPVKTAGGIPAYEIFYFFRFLVIIPGRRYQSGQPCLRHPHELFRA